MFNIPVVFAKIANAKKEEEFVIAPTSDGIVLAVSNTKICKFNKTGDGVLIYRKKEVIFKFTPEFVHSCLMVCPAIFRTEFFGGVIKLDNILI